MESDHFFLVVSDVEGKILQFNKGFERVCSSPIDSQFSKFLSDNSSEEFHHSLELMLGSPKIRRHLMLDHPALKVEGFSQVWWEFLVITTPDMDISGVLGIGVGMQFLEQDMPWDNLVDVLGFGELILDSDFKVRSWDGKILSWFDPKGENWFGRSLFDVFSFQNVNQVHQMLAQISTGDKPRCFLINTTDNGNQTFAALMTVSPSGFHLFLMPKSDSFSSEPEKPLISNQYLPLFPGAIFILNGAGKVIQQNESAKQLGQTLFGKVHSLGSILAFPENSSRFLNLEKAIAEAKNGKSSEIELKFLMKNEEFGFWKTSIKPIPIGFGEPDGIMIQMIDVSAERSSLIQMKEEIEQLKELAAVPSHILRGPLSSIMGILELIDSSQLDGENQKLFSHLKPLTRELDQAIRKQSKKISKIN